MQEVEVSDKETEALKAKIKEDIEDLRNGISRHDGVEQLLNEVRQGIENGYLTWEELGTSEKELEDLFAKAKKGAFKG